MMRLLIGLVNKSLSKCYKIEILVKKLWFYTVIKQKILRLYRFKKYKRIENGQRYPIFFDRAQLKNQKKIYIIFCLTMTLN